MHNALVSWAKCLGEKYLEIAQHKVPCDFLEGVAHCTFLISEHQASSGVWLKSALSLLILIKQICMQYPTYDGMI